MNAVNAVNAGDGEKVCWEWVLSIGYDPRNDQASYSKSNFSLSLGAYRQVPKILEV